MDIQRLEKLAKESFEISKSKGWHDTERSEEHMSALAICEIAEAIEIYREGKSFDEIWQTSKGKPEGILVELIDCVIRLFYLMYSTRGSIDVYYFSEEKAEFTMLNGDFDFVKFGRGFINDIINGDFYEVIEDIFDFCWYFGIDPLNLMEMKNNYNKKRPYRHGKIA